MAARCLIVTVEEQVADLDADTNSIVLPAWLVKAVCIVPGGAYPSYAHGYYPRDNAFYLRWDEIARDREGFTDWMRRHVLGLKDHVALLDALGVSA